MNDLQKQILKLLQKFIHEGLIIDMKNRIISFNPLKQDNVEVKDFINPYIVFSNPHKEELILSLFDWSDFDDGSDRGNPIVQALRNINGWRFNNPKVDIPALMKRFVSVTKSLNRHFDTLITYPASDNLFRQLFGYLEKIINVDYSYEDYFYNIHNHYITEIWDEDDKIERFAQENGLNLGQLYPIIHNCFIRMKKENSGYFSYRMIPEFYRSLFSSKINILSGTLNNIDTYNKAINGKDVLVFDYPPTSDYILSSSGEAIWRMFEPRSITFLTLFTPKFKNDHSTKRVNI